MASEFERKAIEKHERGSKEHGDWDDIDVHAEMMDELLDLYNYSSHHNLDDEIRREVQGFAKYMWKRLRYGKND